MEADLMKEFKERVEELDREIVNFKKDSASRKTPAYKEKKLAKARTLYRDIDILIQEIKAELTEPNPCFELEIKNCEVNYKKYIGDLNLLADAEEEGTSTIQRHIQQQDIRLEAVRKIIEDIDDYITSERTPARAYSKLKLKAINEYWLRVQQHDENFEGNRSGLKITYATKLTEYERDMERICLYLEMQLDPGAPIQRNDVVKLPRVVIPKFTGDYFKWMSFRGLFSVMVKDKMTLANAQKMQMLKTLLDGEASALIADLTITDNNFNGAWQRLTDRYDNNRIIVYKHLHKLITQSLARNESKSLKKLLDTTDQVLLALQNLGRPTDSLYYNKVQMQCECYNN